MMKTKITTYKAGGIETRGIDATISDSSKHVALRIQFLPNYDDGMDYSNDFIDPWDYMFIMYDPTDKDSEHKPDMADVGNESYASDTDVPESGKFYLAGNLIDNRSKNECKSLKNVNISLETRPENDYYDHEEPMISADSPALLYFRPMLKALITNDKFIAERNNL